MFIFLNNSMRKKDLCHFIFGQTREFKQRKMEMNLCLPEKTHLSFLFILFLLMSFIVCGVREQSLFAQFFTIFADSNAAGDALRPTAYTQHAQSPCFHHSKEHKGPS